jgi:uncharacterized protein (TIGR02246 family)
MSGRNAAVDSSADPQIRDAIAVSAKVDEAWRDNDADAFAALFTDDSTTVFSGDVFLNGRDEVRAYMAAGYAGPYRGTRVVGEPVSLRLIGDNTAVLITDGGVLAPGETVVPPERQIRATWTLVRRDGRWLISAYHNSLIEGG